MLENTKYTYALSMWSVEKRPNGWYYSKSATTATGMSGADHTPTK
jgi:hypothetical protein